MKRWQILERFNLGGAGSGHHGHKGISGQRGGSLPSSSIQIGGIRKGAKFDKVSINVDGKDIGYVQYKKTGSKMHINEIVVSESVRGQGVGSSALKELMDTLGVSKISVKTLTPSGLKFFKGLAKRGWDIEFH